ncbi:MAG: tetratricopeptide repeat protein, partial [Prevotella sp.]
HNHKARALKGVIMRLTGADEARRRAYIDETLALDRFNYVCLYELYLLDKDESLLDTMRTMMRRSADNYDEVALDYLAAGCHAEAQQIWEMAIAEGATTPLTYYYMGRRDEAEAVSPDYCFPNRNEAVVALSAAIKANPKGARANYYLGCLYYDRRQYDLAIALWERAAELDAQFPTVWRNLALAYFNKLDRCDTALEYMEKAFALNESDARMLMELDQLYRRMQRPHEARLSLLERHAAIAAKRDDLVIERATLLNQTGRYEEAMALIDGRRFHPWEGGEGKVTAQYQICRTELAKQALAEGNAERAEQLLLQCLDYPQNLGEGRLHGAQENDFLYLLGCAAEMKGDSEEACNRWEQATVGPQEPAAAMYYNDAKPDKIFYQGLALLRLGRKDEANGRFNRLLNYGQNHIFEKQVTDYFAVSLPDLLIWDDSLDTRNRIHCLYMLALGYYGKGDTAHAERYLHELMEADVNHQGAQALLSLMALDRSIAES